MSPGEKQFPVAFPFFFHRESQREGKMNDDEILKKGRWKYIRDVSDQEILDFIKEYDISFEGVFIEDDISDIRKQNDFSIQENFLIARMEKMRNLYKKLEYNGEDLVQQGIAANKRNAVNNAFMLYRKEWRRVSLGYINHEIEDPQIEAPKAIYNINEFKRELFNVLENLGLAKRYYSEKFPKRQG